MLLLIGFLIQKSPDICLKETYLHFNYASYLIFLTILTPFSTQGVQKARTQKSNC